MVTFVAFDNLKGAINMFKKLRELYAQYKPYIKVDLIMYAVLLLSIVIYFIVSSLID